MRGEASDCGDCATEHQLTVPCRALIVGKVDSSNKLRQLDELLEVARAKLVALAAGRHHAYAADPSGTSNSRGDRQSIAADDGATRVPETGAGHSAAAGVAGGEGGSLTGGACGMRLKGGDREELATQCEAAESGQSAGGADAAGADAALRREAKVVAEILQHVGEASALVQGDLAERLHTAARRCAQCGPFLCSSLCLACLRAMKLADSGLGLYDVAACYNDCRAAAASGRGAVGAARVPLGVFPVAGGGAVALSSCSLCLAGEGCDGRSWSLADVWYHTACQRRSGELSCRRVVGCWGTRADRAARCLECTLGHARLRFQ